MGAIFFPARPPALSVAPVGATIPTLTQAGAGTATINAGILGIPFTCSVPGMHGSRSSPLLMNFTGARRHDSKNFLYSIDDFGRNTYGLFPRNICLDFAHDNLAAYRLLARWDINALIDINGRAMSSGSAPDDITFNKLGVLSAGPAMRWSPGAMTP